MPAVTPCCSAGTARAPGDGGTQTVLGLKPSQQTRCSGNAGSQPEVVMEQLVGRLGQHRGAQVHAMHRSD